MMFLEKISPKRFRSAAKKRSRRSVSRSEPTSFSSGSTSSSSSSDALSIPRSKGLATPTSVLGSEISGDWADPAGDPPPEGPFELAQAFKLIDKDGDGKITRQELAAVLRRVGRGDSSEAELVAMLGEVDRDGDGCISLEDFGAIGSARGSELRDVFELFDKDGDGRITAEELLRVFEAIGDDGCTIDDCRLMIDGVSKTGDGFVCFEDFARMMEQQR